MSEYPVRKYYLYVVCSNGGVVDGGVVDGGAAVGGVVAQRLASLDG